MSNPYDFVQAPNIAGAGNYAQQLQQGFAGLGKAMTGQQQPKPPQPGQPGAPGAPQTTSVFNQPQANGTVPAQNNYIGQLLKSLFGGQGGSPTGT